MLIQEAVKHREALVNRARQIVGDNAEDVVSDVVEYLLKGRFNADPERDNLPLLMWYVKRRCIDFKNKEKRRTVARYTFSESESDDTGHDRFESLEHKLQELDPFICRIMILHYAEGKTIPELSQATGIKANRLTYLIHVGKNQIRSNL